MKIGTQYLNDGNGQPMTVQLPIADWEKVLGKLRKYEQAMKLKSDLKEGLSQVRNAKQDSDKAQTLDEFLSEL